MISGGWILALLTAVLTSVAAALTQDRLTPAPAPAPRAR